MTPRLGSRPNDLNRPPLVSQAKRLGDRLIAAPVGIGWHDGDPETPRVEMVFDVIDGKLECVSLTVNSPDARGLMRRDLRAVDIELAREAVAKTFTLPTMVTAEGGMQATFDGWPVSPSETMQNLARTRRRDDGGFLERVAQIYNGNTNGAPTQAVMDVFGVKHRTAGVYVQRARAAGLIPPYRRGGDQNGQH